MEKEKITKDWDYSHWSFRTGTRPFDGLEMMLENFIANINAITRHPDGSVSETKDTVARNSISDTAIIMSYALLEGFFSEEYEYYLKQERPNELLAMINALLHKHDITLQDWKPRRKKIDMVRKLRNTVVHNNGVIKENINVNACKEMFGEDNFKMKGGLSQLSPKGALLLVKEFRDIAQEYAEAVFMPNKDDNAGK